MRFIATPRGEVFVERTDLRKPFVNDLGFAKELKFSRGRKGLPCTGRSESAEVADSLPHKAYCLDYLGRRHPDRTAR